MARHVDEDDENDNLGTQPVDEDQGLLDFILRRRPGFTTEATSSIPSFVMESRHRCHRLFDLDISMDHLDHCRLSCSSGRLIREKENLGRHVKEHSNHEMAKP